MTASVLRWNDLDIEVVHTPGHTRGSVCFRVGPDLLSGDTLFHRGVGRCDLPGGSWPALVFSIEHRIYTLPPETVVYPGHGQRTTVDEEMRAQPICGASALPLIQRTVCYGGREGR